MGAMLVDLRLAPTAHAPATARRALSDALEEYATTTPLEDAALVVSEMVSNAVRHGPDESSVTLDVVATAGTLQISVTDLGAGFEPARAIAGAGYGLSVIEALTRDWGVVSTGDYCRVWCDLDFAVSTQQLEAVS